MSWLTPAINRFKNALPWRINRRPLLILGNQKSGTSVIAALLGRATGLSTTLDIRGIYEPVQSKLHDGTLPFAKFVSRNRLDFSRDIIKEPCLTLLVEALDNFFDEPTYVFVVRDPRHNIRSILDRVGLPGDRNSYDEEEAARRVRNWTGWHKVIDGRWLGIPYSDYVGSLAGRWNLLTDVYIANAHRFTLICYEHFLNDKVGAINDLARRLRLEVRDDISDHVGTQYQPRGNRSADPLTFFGRSNLTRIEHICGERMARFGYKPSLLSQGAH
jgi:hypothetical protein